MKNCRVCFIWALPLACLFLFGCDTRSRSISHSAYQETSTYTGHPVNGGMSDPDFEYRGELNETDILGVSRDEFTSEADIRRALEQSKALKLRPGCSILLIQSGALFPDGPMVAQLSKHFRVLPFSGVPAERRGVSNLAQAQSGDPEDYSRSLRLTAARGGADFILCYWGMLESVSDKLPTKTVSWVPVAHWFVPDEERRMRIQLKLALVDVRSGSWSLLSPKPFEDTRITTSPRRARVDQKQVERLKELAYKASVKELVGESD